MCRADLSLLNTNNLYVKLFISKTCIDLFEEFFGFNQYNLRYSLQVYDVYSGCSISEEKYTTYRLTLKSLSEELLITDLEPGKKYCVDIGVITPQKEFITIVRSNMVETTKSLTGEGSKFPQGANQYSLISALRVESPLLNWSNQFTGYNLVQESGFSCNENI